MIESIKLKITVVAVFVLAAFVLTSLALPVYAVSAESADEKLDEIADEFGPVLRLSGTPAAKEINAIANLITPKSGMMTIDLKHASGELCMLEPTGKRNMIHFSPTPEKSTEDILYFINPEDLKKSGLRVTDLPALPNELGSMVPLKWYYYDGKGIEPHHGKKLGAEFLVMAIDVK